MKVPESYRGLATRCFRGKSWDVDNLAEHGGSIGTYLQLPESGCEEEEYCWNILQLPDDILLSILSYLSILDVGRYAGYSKLFFTDKNARCEASCSMLRYLIVYYGVYKGILDKICRRKRINNYMVLPVVISRDMTVLETRAYYKRRLYQYTYK